MVLNTVKKNTFSNSESYFVLDKERTIERGVKISKQLTQTTTNSHNLNLILVIQEHVFSMGK